MPDVTKARWDRGAESRYMTHKNNWVMVRRPSSVPYVISLRDWLALPLAADGERLSKQYDAALTPSPASK